MAFPFSGNIDSIRKLIKKQKSLKTILLVLAKRHEPCCWQHCSWFERFLPIFDQVWACCIRQTLIARDAVQLKCTYSNNTFQITSTMAFQISYSKCSFYSYLFILLSSNIHGIKILAKTLPELEIIQVMTKIVWQSF